MNVQIFTNCQNRPSGAGQKPPPEVGVLTRRPEISELAQKCVFPLFKLTPCITYILQIYFNTLNVVFFLYPNTNLSIFLFNQCSLFHVSSRLFYESVNFLRIFRLTKSFHQSMPLAKPFLRTFTKNFLMKPFLRNCIFHSGIVFSNKFTKIEISYNTVFSKFSSFTKFSV